MDSHLTPSEVTSQPHHNSPQATKQPLKPWPRLPYLLAWVVGFGLVHFLSGPFLRPRPPGYLDETLEVLITTWLGSLIATTIVYAVLMVILSAFHVGATRAGIIAAILAFLFIAIPIIAK